MMNPWMILGAIVAAVSVYFYGHHKGWIERDTEMQVEIARKNAESREIEQKLNEQINQTSTQLQEANNVVAKKQSDLNRAIAAGRVRLPTTSCVSTTQNPSITTGDRVEARSEPDRQVNETSDADRATLQAIAEIVAEGDRAINQLNACIAAYEQVRGQINGNR